MVFIRFFLASSLLWTAVLAAEDGLRGKANGNINGGFKSIGSFRLDDPNAPDRELRAAQTEKLHSWLVDQHKRRLLQEEDVTIDVPPPTQEELDEINQPTPPGQPMKVGLVRATPWSVSPGSRRIVINTPGAAGVRVHFTSVDADTDVYLYSPKGEAFGPYNAEQNGGDFWTNTVYSDVVFVQNQPNNNFLHNQPKNGPPGGNSAGGFTIAETLLVVTDTSSNQGNNNNRELAFCSYNEDCIVGAGSPGDYCGTNDPAVEDARYAVAYILFVSNGGGYICSGGLINNSNNDGTGYFLTANHCISTASEANSLEATFQKCCTCGCSGQSSVQHSPTGATLLSNSASSDYSLMELNGAAGLPQGSLFLGWNSNPVAFSNGNTLYRIAHPAGAPQAYSQHDVDTSRVTCGTLPRGNFIYSSTTFGGTEGGSSGSPVVNGAGQVVGQLYGACGYNVYDACDHVSNAVVDGALASYFSNVAQWLDPPPPGCTDDADCAGATGCIGAETCNAGICVPGSDTCGASGQICDENIDQCVDCLVDGDCPDDGAFCTGVEVCNAGTCGSSGDPCQAAGETCNESQDRCDECVDDGDCAGATGCIGAETCDAGTCVPGSSMCPIGEFCDVTSSTCVACLVDGDCPLEQDSLFCTVEVCTAAKTCSTVDRCPGAMCNESTDQCVDCLTDTDCVDDGEFCNGVETCNTAGNCVSSGNPCDVGKVCNEDTNSCDTCGSIGDPCVSDSDCCSNKCKGKPNSKTCK